MTANTEDCVHPWGRIIHTTHLAPPTGLKEDIKGEPTLRIIHGPMELEKAIDIFHDLANRPSFMGYTRKGGPIIMTKGFRNAPHQFTQFDVFEFETIRTE